MDRAVFERMEAQEEAHWWFAARRDIIRTVIMRLTPPREGRRVLEAGCGTGGNLDMLGEFGQLRAFELDETARLVACAKSDLAVAEGALPDNIPFANEAFDLIGLFDVLEHVEDHEASLAQLRAKLNQDGRIVMTVPAFPWLWSAHDTRHHHFRRYTKASLTEVAAKAGLRVEHSFYFNTALFPVAVATRALKSLLRINAADDTMPGAFSNKVLRKIFASERHLIGRLPMPVGLSLGAVLSARLEDT